MKLFLPSIGVLLAFVPLYWATGSQGWFLTRIVITSLMGIMGLVYFLSKIASYDDICDVGLIIGFVGFVFIGYTVLAFMGGIATLFLISIRRPLATGTPFRYTSRWSREGFPVLPPVTSSVD